MNKDLAKDLARKLSEKFRRRLQEATDDKGYTQANLHELTGIDKSAISNYFHGGYEPKTEKICLLADALGVNTSWLMGIDVEKYPCQNESKQENSQVVRPRNIELFEKINKLDADDLRTIETTVNSMLKSAKYEIAAEKELA